MSSDGQIKTVQDLINVLEKCPDKNWPIMMHEPDPNNDDEDLQNFGGVVFAEGTKRAILVSANHTEDYFG